MSGPSQLPSVAHMTWAQHHERMAFMADLIERAAENPEAAIDFNGNLPDVQRLFGSGEGLLLSLQQRWVTALTARLDDDVPAEQARAELVARDPGLRAVLDAAARRSVRVRAVQRDEQQIVATFAEQTVA
jgi:ATP adenylyltransferase